MSLNRDNYFTYEKFQAALENSTITFSMVDVETGVYYIAKKEGGLIPKEHYTSEVLPQVEYEVYYKFTRKDTNRPGRYRAEFKIDFFDTVSTDITGSFVAPIHDELFINVKKSLFTDTNRNNNIIPINNDGIFTDAFNSVFS